MCFFKKFKIKRLTKKIKSLQQSRVHNQPSEENIKKEVDLYHTLASLYLSLQGNKKFPFAWIRAMECYRASTNLEDSAAQYILGKNLLEEAKLRQELQTQEIFASNSNEKQMKQLYEEALAYLEASEKLNHVQAKRLRGLIYINGWGVEADKRKGFDLIVASIDQENSWDRVPQIFAAIGLNKPEFFSALAQHKKS